MPWTAAQKLDFLANQFALQHAYYRANYPGAEFLVITDAGQTIGRIYLRRSGNEIRLMEIALVEQRRDQGLGGLLIQALCDLADRDACEITLHVEPGNPACRLYRRLGFELIEERGVNSFLGRPPRRREAG